MSVIATNCGGGGGVVSKLFRNKFIYDGDTLSDA